MVRPFWNTLIVLLAGAAAALTLAAQPMPFKIVFTDDKPADGAQDRGRPAAYNRSLGYGFDYKTKPSADGAPFYFSVAVPEGNFNVTLGLGSATEACVTAVRAESRRWMLDDVHTAAGEIVARTITVNVRTSHVTPPPVNAPGGSEVRLNDREQGSLTWDDKLTLEFNGAHPCVASVEVTAAPDTPTVFVAGDSTVTDQPRGGASWGQMLTAFFGPGIAVANHAESGETLKSFLTGLRFDKMLEHSKKGDYLFMQFGHNDEKENWPQTYVEAMSTYKQYLRTFITEARRRGIQPVLVTPMQRRMFDGTKIRNSHRDYPDAVRQLAKDENVPLIDLSTMSVAFYEALGPEKSPVAFAGNGRDATHHSPYGAYELARCIVEGIKANKLDLVKYLNAAATAKTFDPGHPDAPESLVFTTSPATLPRPQRTPTLWVIGDSTVRNGSGDGRNGQWGWGDKLAPYFDPAKINVVNKALGGRSSRTYITEGLWEEVLTRIQPGDLVMMQFGHNDGSAPEEPTRARGSLKGVGEESREIENPIMHRHETVYTFGAYMRKYVTEARARGAVPLICSPIPRMNWKDGHIGRNKADYAGWSEEVAVALKVPFIDLNETIAAKLDTLGEKAVEPLYFGDHTHTSLVGAELNASCVVRGLKELKENPLGTFLSAKASEPNSCEVKIP